jgi:uncharacterized protein with FMN-binding domain
MRRVILAIASTVAGLVLLLTFKTHSTSGGAAPPAAISTPSTGGSSAGAPGAGAPASGGSTTGGKTVTGAAANTIYGPVQVQITVKSGKVTGAKAVEYPQETSRDIQINTFAIPVLNREAASIGSAKIDMVSGATYTSQGYITSLQSALDQAGR